MFTFVLRRLLYCIPVLVVASFLIFVFVASTVDPLGPVKTNPVANQHSIQLAIDQNHLDDPVVYRYGYWVRDLFTNGLGHTIVGDRPILPEIKRVLGNTLQLVLVAEALTLLLAIAVGVFSALRQYSFFDYTATTLSFLGLAMPVFWLGLILQILSTELYTQTHVRLVYTAALSSIDPGHGIHFLIDRVQHLVLPVITLAIINIAAYSRFMRASMLEVVNADYVRTARAKGLLERKVVLRHAFRNALIPLVTLAAIDIGTLFGGAVITETIFGLDGMGRYFVNALGSGETYSLMAWMMITATMIVLFNLLADVALGILDPRIRLD
jgi:peptide/nickel transport system permease protein